MRSTLAPETIIHRGLRELGCSQRHFCSLVGFSYPSFAAVMAGTRNFEPAVAERFKLKLRDMKELVESLGVTPDWSRIEDISRILALKLVERSRDGD